MVRAALIWLALLSAAPAAAQCRLALLLGLDVSSSVDAAEDRLQRDGLADALLAPDVTRALLANPGVPVILAVYEWSGRRQQALVLDWTAMSTPQAISQAAQTIRSSRRRYQDYPTALGHGIAYAASVFRIAPDCLFRTLDISGDGINNDGYGPDSAYAHFALDGVTVNGLAIGGATGDDSAVLDYYLEDVIRGPGAFVETANDFSDFKRAMRRKLLREVQARVIGSAARLPREDG